MSSDIKVLTAEEMFWDMPICDGDGCTTADAIQYAKRYARQVAVGVMKECANKAQVSYMACGDQMNCGCQGRCEHPTASVNRVGMLLIDFEQFIK